MSKMRLRKVEAILSELRAKNAPPTFKAIEYTSHEDSERQCAALREQGFKGVIACFPKKREWPDGEEGQDVEYSAEPEPGETPAQSAPAGDVAP